MNTATWIILCVICAALGAVMAALVMKQKCAVLKDVSRMHEKNSLSAQQQLSDINTLYAQTKEQLASMETSLKYTQNQCEELRQEKSELQNRLHNAETAASDLKASLSKTEENNRHLEDWINGAEKSLSDKFEALSKKVMDNNNTVFIEKANDKLKDFEGKLNANLQGSSKEVGNIITPVSEQLKELQKKIEELEKNRISAYTGLSTNVEELKKQNTQLHDATQLLNDTLKNTAQRGKWGEEQLHKIAELAGMVEHIDYEEQHTTDSKDSQRRPDMTIHLTGGRVVPVDSKVPMDAYLNYVQATEPAEQKRYLAEHCSAVRKHIDSLSKKEYWKEFERSAQFVVMVVPYESGLSATFENDRDVFNYGMGRNVLLLSPITFYAFLKSVSLGWAENKMAQNAKEIAFAGKVLIERIDKFYEHMDKIGKSLRGTVENYNSAISSYNTRLLPSMNRFRELNSTELVSPKEELPEPTESPQRLRKAE